MGQKNEIIQTHSVVGWDISLVNVYNAMMVRLHCQSSQDEATNDVSVDKTLWLPITVAKQLILNLQAGIEEIESLDGTQLDHTKH
ncbi:MAG: biofilm formation regulator BssS [Enterobacteriaceae bacterium]|jgi:biofilm regulator BssS|nr:biofilm formation regulator BssS [Enterobacteriaceae bacterium]